MAETGRVQDRTQDPTLATAQDVVDLLLTQHAQIETLFAEVAAATGDRQQELLDELVRLLAVHETAEEEVVHPRARTAIDAGDEVVDDRLAEERAAKEMLAQLYKMGPADPGFPDALLALRDAVLVHAKHEERYEFPQLRHAVDAAQRQRLAAAVRAAEAVAPTRPHPGVESVKANLVAGPPAAVFDRIRDLVRDTMRR
jgi:hemerythrin superfamily protein